MASIAVVDDDADIRDLLREVLTQAGHTDCCADRDELMRVLDHDQVDVVVLDFVLGERQELRGLQLLTELRNSSRLRAMPVLILSADVDALREHAPQLEQMPLTEVLLKPFGVTDIEDAVRGLSIRNASSDRSVSAPPR